MKPHPCQNRRRFIKTLGTLVLSGTALPAFTSAGLLFSDQSTMNNLKIDSSFEPSYLKLHRDGSLKMRAEILWDRMNGCDLCPRDCGKNRIRGNRGDCNANAELEISSFAPHFGEERELVGSKGSGTIFFTNCALLCVFCINYDVSQLGRGRKQTVRDLANMMLNLQRTGCHNINVVSPSHYVAHILMALDIAAGRGLRLPVAYNTCGWERADVLQFLDGVVDIYLADFKYYDSRVADRYSPGAITYPQDTKIAILEMNRQVGVAKPGPDGLITRGLMIRHLVMPNNVPQSERIMTWIGNNLPKDTYVNIMSQYTPVFKADQFPEINRRITRGEYNDAIAAARRAGLTNLRLQNS